MCCSGIEDKKEVLVKLAKRMKKSSISIDIVAFGDLTDENLEKLRAFNEAVKGGDGSHLEVVYPSSNLLSDTIVASPILAGEGGAGAANGAGANGESGGGGGGGTDFEFGVDPNLDPELALVLRMSMEEERERQAREQRARDEAEGKTNLESVPEEGGGETQPLLDGQDGEASGSGGVEVKKEEGDEKKDGDGADKMDTA